MTEMQLALEVLDGMPRIVDVESGRALPTRDLVVRLDSKFMLTAECMLVLRPTLDTLSCNATKMLRIGA